MENLQEEQLIIEEEEEQEEEYEEFIIKALCITTNKPYEFIDKLEQLCEEYSLDGDYFFAFG